jgi:ABC-type multidrug transport system fused ATPase/permease subunit
MDAGVKVASGRHQDLLQSSELYGRLAKLQFSAEAN